MAYKIQFSTFLTELWIKCITTGDKKNPKIQKSKSGLQNEQLSSNLHQHLIMILLLLVIHVLPRSTLFNQFWDNDVNKLINILKFETLTTKLSQLLSGICFEVCKLQFFLAAVCYFELALKKIAKWRHNSVKMMSKH